MTLKNHLTWVTALITSALISSCATANKSQRTIAQNTAPDCTILTSSQYPVVDAREAELAKDKKRGLQQYYFTAAEREQHRFVVIQGTIYNHDCSVMTSYPSSGEPVNYVMDAAGNFYWVDENKDPQTRHSAVFSGAPVSGAGNITINNSQIMSIDSDSGHYPSGPVFDNVLKQLQLDGVDLSKVTVTHNLNNDP